VSSPRNRVVLAYNIIRAVNLIGAATLKAKLA
jgi:hypothetical protein